MPWSRAEDASVLWERVPPVCSPHMSRLGPSLLSPHLLAAEKVRQEKLRRKLERQVERGAISQEERQLQLERVGRESVSGESLKRRTKQSLCYNVNLRFIPTAWC